MPGGGEGGFTLTELIIAIAVLGVVMAGTLGLLMAGQQGYLASSNLVEAQQNVRVALDRMVREIRQAGYDPRGTALASCPSDATRCPLTEATATSLTIQVDVSADGAIQPQGADGASDSGDEEVVRYFLNGTRLERQAGTAAAQPIIGGVQALTFQYFDADGVTLATPVTNLAAIRSVGVTLTTEPERVPGSYQAGKVTRVMTDQVRLRSLQ